MYDDDSWDFQYFQINLRKGVLTGSRYLKMHLFIQFFYFIL